MGNGSIINGIQLKFLVFTYGSLQNCSYFQGASVGRDVMTPNLWFFYIALKMVKITDICHHI